MSANIEKELDFADYDKDEPEESKAVAKAAKKAADGKVAKKVVDAKEKNFQDAIAEKAAKETAQKEIDTILAGLKPDQKAKLLAAQGVVASPVSILPRVKYDHAATLKSLVKTTESARALMVPLKDDYEAVVYMGALCDYWKSLMTQDRAQINAHAAFKKYFKKVQHLHGLPVCVKTGLGDLSLDDDEDAGAGAN